jgi:hypothetical protein
MLSVLLLPEEIKRSGLTSASTDDEIPGQRVQVPQSQVLNLLPVLYLCSAFYFNTLKHWLGTNILLYFTYIPFTSKYGYNVLQTLFSTDFRVYNTNESNFRHQNITIGFAFLP